MARGVLLDLPPAADAPNPKQRKSAGEQAKGGGLGDRGRHRTVIDPDVGGLSRDPGELDIRENTVARGARTNIGVRAKYVVEDAIGIVDKPGNEQREIRPAARCRTAASVASRPSGAVRVGGSWQGPSTMLRLAGLNKRSKFQVSRSTAPLISIGYTTVPGGPANGVPTEMAGTATAGVAPYMRATPRTARTAARFSVILDATDTHEVLIVSMARLPLSPLPALASCWVDSFATLPVGMNMDSRGPWEATIYRNSAPFHHVVDNSSAPHCGNISARRLRCLDI